MQATISSRDHFSQPHCRLYKIARDARRAHTAGLSPDAPPGPALAQRSKAEKRKNESGLTLVSHAIAPTHDDVREPSPDDGRTTMRDHARCGLRRSRRHRRATRDIPRPTRDDGSKPIRDDSHATNARHAIRDAHPSRRSDRNDLRTRQPARRRTAQLERRRREMFGVSLLVPPAKRAILGGEIPHARNTMHSQCQFQRAQKSSKISGALGERAALQRYALEKSTDCRDRSAVELETYESVRNRA